MPTAGASLIILRNFVTNWAKIILIYWIFIIRLRKLAIIIIIIIICTCFLIYFFFFLGTVLIDFLLECVWLSIIWFKVNLLRSKANIFTFFLLYFWLFIPKFIDITFIKTSQSSESIAHHNFMIFFLFIIFNIYFLFSIKIFLCFILSF